MARGLLGGIPDIEATMKQIHNNDHEHVVLVRFPFHQCVTRQAALNMYRNAVQYMFQIVPHKHHIPVMGRFSRKLIKLMHEFEEKERNQ